MNTTYPPTPSPATQLEFPFLSTVRKRPLVDSTPSASMPPSLTADAKDFYTLWYLFDQNARSNGWIMQGINFKRKEKSVLVVLTASKGGQDRVAFVTGTNFYTAAKEAADLYRRKQINWKPSRYPRRKSNV